MKVFLGGTCNESKWREKLIEDLTIDYFNPVVDDWNEEAQEQERYEREHCDYVLYVITPKMKGVYSIAEVVDDSNKRPLKTIFCFLKEDNGIEFDKGQIKSMEQVARMVEENGALVVPDLFQASLFLNHVGE